MNNLCDESHSFRPFVRLIPIVSNHNTEHRLTHRHRFEMYVFNGIPISLTVVYGSGSFCLVVEYEHWLVGSPCSFVICNGFHLLLILIFCDWSTVGSLIPFAFIHFHLHLIFLIDESSPTLSIGVGICQLVSLGFETTEWIVMIIGTNGIVHLLYRSKSWFD